jgi:hypothetical protein
MTPKQEADLVKEFMMAMIAADPEEIPEEAKDRNQKARLMRSMAQAYARQIKTLAKRGTRKTKDEEEDDDTDD